jgi:MATE family multidrug resistance protein
MKKLDKDILRLAIPNIVGNLSVPLLGVVDTALMGHFAGVVHLGAVSLGSMIFSLLYWGFGFLRMGTTGLVAQSFGRNEIDNCYQHLIRGLIFAVCLSGLILILSPWISSISFQLSQCSKEVEKLASVYFDYRIYAAPATLCLYVIMGYFYGMQDAVSPLKLTLLTNILNIIFNCIFLFGLGMKSDGVALGTVLAQYFGLIAGLFMLTGPGLKKAFSDFKRVCAELSLWDYLAMNRDLMLRTVLLLLSLSWFTSRSGALGNDVLAVNSILMQFIYILSYGVDGFAHAVESLSGAAYGNGDYSLLKAVIKRCTFWGYLFSVFYFLILWVDFSSWLTIFTPDDKLISLGMIYRWWVFSIPLLGTLSYLMDGIFVGVTRSREMRNVMIFVSLFLFFPVEYGMRGWGNHGLWLALSLFMSARGIVSLYYLPSIFSKPDAL